MKKINQWAFQWELSFNPDLSKQAQEVIFIGKIKKLPHPSLVLNNNDVLQTSQMHLGVRLNVNTMFPSYRIAMAPFQFSYRIGLLFPLEHIFFGMIFITERGGTLRFWKWYEVYRIAIDPLRKANGNTSGTIIGYDFEFKWKQKTYNY